MIDKRTRKLQQTTNEQILTCVNSKADISFERNKASFSSKDLELLLVEDDEEYKLRKKCLSILKEDPMFFKYDRYFLSREHLYKKTLSMQLRIHELASKMENRVAAAKIMNELIDEPGALDMHSGMFIPTIMNEGNNEQKNYWLPLALDTKLIGTYAQTELGHQIETTATFDVISDEFIIHSPSITSTKWCSGGMGKTATHVIIIAQLFINERNHGPHSFIVQIRHLSNHQPLQGIKVGDIGNQFGCNAADNGYIRFDHLRIPRNNMLMKNFKVSQDGTYHISPNIHKISCFRKVDVIMNASLHLKKVLTIAIRYNSIKINKFESKNIDCQHNQRTLFPLLSTAFALHFTGKAMKQSYYACEQNDSNTLQEINTTTCGLKAVSTWKTKHGIELSMISCGSHALTQLSCFPHTIANYNSQLFYEGDNNILCLETCQYLVKAKSQAISGHKLSGYCVYMNKSVQDSSSIDVNNTNYSNISKYIDAFEYRINSLLNENTSQENIIDSIEIVKAHCEYVILTEFVKGVNDIPKSKQNILIILYKLISLYALTIIEENIGYFVIANYFNKQQVKYISNEINRLLKEIRPEAVSLVDSFGFDDYYLNSALGKYDGDVYNELYNWIRKGPTNRSEYGMGYNELLKPRISKL